jgi:diacylglycerol kinase
MRTYSVYKKVGFALQGIRIAWREEISFRMQLGGLLVLLGAGWFFSLKPLEWILLIGSMGAVLSAELFNTALEEFCDMHTRSHDPHVARIKDLAAGAVLVTSLMAFAVVAFIFVPHLTPFVLHE